MIWISKNYYYDEGEQYPKYKLENKPDGYRLPVEKLPNYVRKENFILQNIVWKSLVDELNESSLQLHNAGGNIVRILTKDNKEADFGNFIDTNKNFVDVDKLHSDSSNFQPLIEHIINNNISINIDGRAGTGKSTFINQLQKEFEDRGISYKSLAYTNKACRIINGTTIHKFIKTMSSKALQEMQFKYIIVDEISMVPEIFYKYFCIIKKFRPDIKFVTAGDYCQLLPVKDRIGSFDYKNSWCLNELVDGNRLQLTKCRRSDDKLFNMLLPKNIGKLKPSNFGNEFTERHITLSNKRRKHINDTMMTRESFNKKYLELDKLEYDDNSQDVKLIEDMPIIARKNAKEYDICNNEQFTINKINFDKNIIVITDDDKTIDIPFDMFQKLFYPAYAITIFKSQGSTFDYPYTIHEWNHPLFDNRLKYVSASRATDINNINVII